MRTLYVHIGLHKTATTFLQREIFPKLLEIDYVDQREAGIRNKLIELMKHLGQKRLSDEDYGEIRRFIKHCAKGNKVLISNEGLSGNPFIIEGKGRVEILKDIKKAFGDFRIRIILGIREQSDLIISLYKQYLSQGGTKSLEGFLRRYSNFLDLYKYSQYIDSIKRIFGESNMYIYLYEDIRTNKNKALRGLMNFLGEKKIPDFKDVSYNIGYGVLQIRLARIINYFFKSPENPKGLLPVLRLRLFGRNIILRPRLFLKYSQKIAYKRYAMPDYLSKKIKEFYIEDNRNVNKEYGLNLPSVYLNSY